MSSPFRLFHSRGRLVETFASTGGRRANKGRTRQPPPKSQKQNRPFQASFCSSDCSTASAMRRVCRLMRTAMTSPKVDTKSNDKDNHAQMAVSLEYEGPRSQSFTRSATAASGARSVARSRNEQPAGFMGSRFRFAKVVQWGRRRCWSSPIRRCSFPPSRLQARHLELGHQYVPPT